MMRSPIAIALVASAVLTGSMARAQAPQQFGDKGEFIIGGDRLMPLLAYSHYSRSVPPPAGTTDASQGGDNTTLGLFYGSTLDLNNHGDVGTDFPSSAFFAVPRIGFDYVLAPNITIGGDVVVFFTLGGGRSTQTDFANGTSMTSQQESQSLTVFGVAPRAGYIMKLTDSFSLWLRGGVSFYNGTLKTSGPGGTTQTNDSQYQFALDLEPQLVFTPIPHVGFTAALDADLSPSFLGGYSHQDVQLNNTTINGSADVVYIGATLGMLVYF
jgi:hypothetical protein